MKVGVPLVNPQFCSVPDNTMMMNKLGEMPVRYITVAGRTMIVVWKSVNEKLFFQVCDGSVISKIGSKTLHYIDEQYDEKGWKKGKLGGGVAALESVLAHLLASTAQFAKAA